MGLDLYAGTFTRYYTRNWKTVVEAWAEANGVDFKRTDADDEEKLSPEEVREIVCNWRDGERQKFCVHGIIGARQTGASNEHEHQTQFS